MFLLSWLSVVVSYELLMASQPGGPPGKGLAGRRVGGQADWRPVGLAGWRAGDMAGWRAFYNIPC